MSETLLARLERKLDLIEGGHAPGPLDNEKLSTLLREAIAQVRYVADLKGILHQLQGPP